MIAEATGRTRVAGCEIGWRRLGTGPPLIVLNGYAATKNDWDPVFLGRLAQSFDALCIESRGLGDSELGGEKLSVERMAEDVLGVMDELEIGRAPILGWSMGGFIAQQAAALGPDRVEALVLLSTDHGGPGIAPWPADVYAELIDQGGSPREQASRLIGLLFPPDVAESIDSQFGEVVAAARAELSPEALTAQEEALERWHAEGADERIAALTMPALAAAGVEDRVIPVENSALIASRLPSAWLARFPGGGHGFMAQQPRRLAALISAFLAEA